MSQPVTLLSAVPVPFETNGDLDVKGQQTLLRHLADTGIGGVFVAGTTGEFTALDDDERAVVFSAALEVFGAESVYAHVGAAAARQAERLTVRAVALGARNLAAITPFYLPAGPVALIDYYRRLDAWPQAPGSSSTCTPRAVAARSPPTSSPSWRRSRPLPGRRSAASRHPL
jgi:4-hydroxy-tetrahydrodipicolinate synthase